MVTVAAAMPRPAMICTSRPPKEWPITIGFWSRPAMTSATWSATSATDVPASESACGVRLGDGRLVAGPVDGDGGVARVLEVGRASGPSCSASSHRPWTKTTGLLPDCVGGGDLGGLAGGDGGGDGVHGLLFICSILV